MGNLHELPWLDRGIHQFRGEWQKNLDCGQTTVIRAFMSQEVRAQM